MTKWIAIFSAVLCTGCATTYTVTSATAYVLTGKSIPDHATSQLTASDCDAVRMVTRHTWYCEMRDPSVTYNRTGY